MKSKLKQFRVPLKQSSGLSANATGDVRDNKSGSNIAKPFKPPASNAVADPIASVLAPISTVVSTGKSTPIVAKLKETEKKSTKPKAEKKEKKAKKREKKRKNPRRRRKRERKAVTMKAKTKSLHIQAWMTMIRMRTKRI